MLSDETCVSACMFVQVCQHTPGLSPALPIHSTQHPRKCLVQRGAGQGGPQRCSVLGVHQPRPPAHATGSSLCASSSVYSCFPGAGLRHSNSSYKVHQPVYRQRQNLILSTLSWVSTSAKKAERLPIPRSHVAPQSATRRQPDSQHMHSDKPNTIASFTTYRYLIHDPTKI